MFRKIFFCTLFLLKALEGNSQTTLWGFNIGSTTADVGRVCKVAPNGNVYVAGKFTGTMDLDPGSATHNIVSNGQDDVFVACYNAAGVYQWGFGIGGAGYDAALYMATDTGSNLILCGYMQGSGIDFDPSAAGAYIGYSGGSGLPYNGDGFVAKYSSSGAYLWAKDIGSTTVNDASISLATDPPGNIYLGGIFEGSMSIYGGSLNSGSGKAYLIKYNPAGVLVWGHNFGSSNNDCYPNSLQVSGNAVFVGGYFAGTADFNPWGASAYLTATGSNDAFLAKYDTAGNYQFAKAIHGNDNDDEVKSVYPDTAGNIYVTGFTTSTALVFDSAAASTSTVSAPGGGTNYDFFIAKYNNAGTYQWGKITGSSGNDYGYADEISRGYLYCSGSFHNTVDFDPSSSVANLTSAGGEDIFLTKYDLNGRYICGFRTGSASTDDAGYGIAHTDSGYLYNTGQFGATGVDFNPSSFTLPLSSNGSSDAYLVKHHWSNDTAFSGYLSGDTICLGQPAYLTLHIAAGSAGPYTITLYNGSTSSTVTGVYANTPFLVTPTPTVTTTYTVTGALPSGANLCTLPPASVLGSATVIVNSVSTVIADSLVGCNKLLLTASNGDTTYRWNFGDGSISTLSSPVHTYTAAGTYIARVTITDSNSCTATDTVMFTIRNPPYVNLGRDTFLCANSYLVQSAYTYPATAVYAWSTGASSPSILTTTSGTFRLRVTDGLCTLADTVVVTLKQQPIVSFGNDTSFCNGSAITLSAFIPAGSAYTWSTGITGSAIAVNTTGSYWLTVNNGGCKATDTINVTVKPLPEVHLGPDKTQCQGGPVILQTTDTSSFVTYLWNTGAPTPFIVMPTGGNYWLAVTLNGCTATDSIKVTINPKPIVDLGNDGYLCKGASLVLSSSQPAGAQYYWSNGTTNSTLTITEPGIYKLAVNLNGCIDSDQVVISAIKAPTINLGQDTLICNGYVLHLLATADQATYLWSDGSGGKSFNINEAGTYWTTITNDCGSATDTINVHYKFCDIFFPNAFTPNGDGKNDILRVKGSLNEFTEYALYIFNRWGQLVFKTETITEGWDGNYKGSPAENGTYFYQMYYKVEGRKEYLKGDVELIR